MRLINLPPQDQSTAPLVLMALGNQKEGDVCYHYRTTRDHGTHMSVDGLEIVLATEQKVEGQQPDGLTVDVLLAICEDRAKHQGHDDHRMRLVALNLLAARRALAGEKPSGYNVPHSTGDVQNPSSIGTATSMSRV